ncbi:MAG: helix-turn-helix domain-containing protein [Pirellulales bacterium]|nr:helix-turn-helix domain-containing protein [Pirellulales bacterium]
MSRNKKEMTRYKYEPDYAVPPGQTLQETIDSRGIDQKELAKRADLSVKHVNQIVKGIAPITQDTAIRLERVTGVAARMWNNLEAIYREQLARIEEKDRLQKGLEWLKAIPTNDLIARGCIKKQVSAINLLDEVLCFFGVANVDAWREGWELPQFAFRKSPKVKGNVGAIATWLRLCELSACAQDCARFSRHVFKAAVDDIRALTIEEPEVFVPDMVERCAGGGVALVLIPEVKGAPVSGAAKWLTPDKAMIGLNLRGKSDDRFWFTFFHEAGHILNDSKKETFVDIEYQDDPREQNANDFAATMLIPKRFESQLTGLKSHADVTTFAAEIGIAPGIVVGRLQREQVIPYSHLNRLKRRLRWSNS